MRAIEMGTTQSHASPLLSEADRLMVVCNSCRYCEGLCAVFPAMELRRQFSDSDLNYLANLCHSCGACYVDCQFSPPHEFQVNVPRALAAVRNSSYEAYAWPRAASAVFKPNGLIISIAVAASVAAFIAGFAAFGTRGSLFAVHEGPAAFYRLMPHEAMATLFGLAFLYAMTAIFISAQKYWKDIVSGQVTGARSFIQALKDTASLRYLHGGRGGCFDNDDRPSDRRRYYHHATFYGFLLCFSSTCVATLYHYLLGREAPYPWFDVPVLLGTVGGIGLIVGPIGLLFAKWRRDRALADETRFGMDVAFLVMLALTSATGLALLSLRSTPAMGLLLSIHLGVVLALFLTLPYGKFVHGIYRFIALVKYAAETKHLR